MARKGHTEELNRILRHPECDPEDFYVVYEHRGTAHGMRAVRVSEIAEAGRRSLVLRSGTHIPLHRVVQVRNHRTGEIVAGDKLENDDKVWEELVGEAHAAEREARRPQAEKETSPETSVFFTSDHHFGHAKIIAYCDRPYTSVEEMDRDLIARWNAVVGEDDTVYHLGDFTLGGPDEAQRYFRQLNGSIHVLPGSHDSKWFGRQDYFSKSDPIVHEPPLLTLGFPRKGRKGLVIVLCHYAMRVWPLSHYGSLHLYGHSHGRLPPEGRSMDVGVDVRREPFELEEIEGLLKGHHGRDEGA